MKKELLKTICMTIVALLCVGTLMAQVAVIPKFQPTEQTTTYSVAPNLPLIYQNSPPPSKGELLWDNLEINVGTTGQVCTFWSGGDEPSKVNWFFMADDFKSDGKWIIETVTIKGFSSAGYPPPTKMAVGIYKDNVGKPGEEIYRENAIPVSPHSNYFYTINLPSPFQLPATAKYWISMAGVYDVVVESYGDVNNGSSWTNTFFAFTGTTGIGSITHSQQKVHIWPAADFPNWSPINGQSSICFKIEGVRVPSDCDPVTDLEVNYTGDCKAVLSWTGHDDAQSYDVYRNDAFIKNTEETTFIDQIPDNMSNLSYDVVVKCKDGENSGMTNLFMAGCVNCDPITNLNVVYQDECIAAELSWSEPLSLYEGTFKYHDTPFEGLTGYETGTTDMSCAIRITPKELAETGVVTGQVLTKLNIGIGDSLEYVNEMEILIWEGGASLLQEGVQVHKQSINILSLVENEINEIVLTTPVLIDSKKEIRIALHSISKPNGAPILLDNAPPISNKSNVFKIYQEGGSSVWRTLEDYGIKQNFVISAVFEKGDAEKPEWKYRIYRDLELIKDNHTEPFYTDDKFVATLSHSWLVKYDCLAGSSSYPVNKNLGVCVGVTEPVKAGFTIFPNPARESIQISAETNFNKIEIVSFLGQVLISQPNSSKSVDINVSNLSNGVYFVRIISETGTSVQKFIKQ